MSLSDDAVSLAARLPVFPLCVDKRPCWSKREGGKGFHDATQEEQEVRRLFSHRAAALIGVPTGERSQISVLDIDPKNDGHVWLEQSIDSLPITRIHHTRSGGKHFLFRHAAGIKNTEGKIGRGVDTRGDGGYIVWWPQIGCQVENSELIEEWPVWLSKLAKPREEPQRRVTVPATFEEGSTRAQLMIKRAYDRVRAAPPGQRHYQLRAAAATIGGLYRFLSRNMDHIEQDLVALAMEAGGEDRSNAEKTVRWAMNKGSNSPLLTRK